MTATRLLVLGVVHKFGQAHGYQVRRELLTWRADAWAKVAPGSIYQALRTLTKHGMLEPVATESGAGPERTVHRLTPDGETELFHLVRVSISEPPAGQEALNAAFAFLHLLRRAELVDLLGHRARALRGELTGMEPPEDSFVVDEGTPEQVEALGRLYGAQLRVALDWTTDLAERVRNGAYAFADEQPGSKG